VRRDSRAPIAKEKVGEGKPRLLLGPQVSDTETGQNLWGFFLVWSKSFSSALGRCIQYEMIYFF
jgi:hypothetical protein